MRAYWQDDNGNWGDIISPLILEKLSGEPTVKMRRTNGRKLLAVGSILHHLKAYDHVWGAGAIKADAVPKALPAGIVVHAVRGPRTRKVLQRLGADVPEIYGDPAILIPELFQIPKLRSKSWSVALVPHYVDMPRVLENFSRSNVHSSIELVDIRGGFFQVINAVNNCERVVASSLHGVILGEALGKPTTWAKFGGRLVGGEFKFRDYYEGTDRTREPIELLGKLSEHLIYSAAEGAQDPPVFDTVALKAACPVGKV